MTTREPSRVRQWLRNLVRITLMALVIAIVFVAIAGRDGTWRMLGGPADMGEFDFKNIARSSRPNNFLLCPPDYCVPGPPDQISPVFSVSAGRLGELFREVAMADENVVRIFAGGPERNRYVQRTPLLRFPDTISAVFIPLDEDNSTLAVYSRSQIGYSDRGVNQKRIYRWLEALSARAAAE